MALYKVNNAIEGLPGTKGRTEAGKVIQIPDEHAEQLLAVGAIEAHKPAKPEGTKLDADKKVAEAEKK